MRFKTIWFKGLAIVAPLSLTTIAAISCSNNNPRSEESSNAQNDAKDQNTTDINNKETIESNKADKKQESSTDATDSKNNEKTEIPDTTVTPKPESDSEEKANDNHEDAQSDSKVDNEKTESDQKEDSVDSDVEKEKPESEPKDEAIVEPKEGDEKDTPTTDEQTEGENEKSESEQKDNDVTDSAEGETKDVSETGSESEDKNEESGKNTKEDQEKDTIDTNSETEDQKDQKDDSLDSEEAISDSEQKDPVATEPHEGEKQDTPAPNSPQSTDETSEEESEENDQKTEKRNYKDEIDRLKSEINVVKESMTDKTFSNLEEKLQKILSDNAHKEDDGVETLSSKKAKLELVKNQLDEINNSFNKYKDLLLSLDLEYDTYDALISKINDKINLFKQNEDNWNSRINVTSTSNEFNNNNSLLPWSIKDSEEGQWVTRSFFDKNSIYNTFLNVDYLKDKDKENIKKHLNDLTGLKNMIAGILGFGINFKELYGANGNWIIKEDQLNKSQYDIGFNEYKVSDNNGTNGLHPRKLENWLIFNSDDRQSELGGNSDSINNKVNQLTTQFKNSKKTWEDFKNEQFTNLQSRIDSFKVLRKEGKEDSQNLAKELSEAYYSGLLNLVYLKSYLTITISQLEEVKTKSEEVKALLDKLGTEEPRQEDSGEATE
ncbi:hypothetical protein [Mycoplasma sp. CSL7503-lung]|uniref:hypothetical protein n=1 Tax=Mycoplasma sp. CSL7503-lung TaxID=536372 RepID=UPI0021D122C9|nr:hypothetical protein [Mycoplasma sp. CSL7503-lung]MCU4706457.1 hypothetical protein [Mycoplasma sp. CSL7503-lung]